MMRNLSAKNIKNQRGAALAVSLILLVAMTILGVASLNSTRLTEKVASNAQQKAIAFETAESMIESIYTSPNFEERIYESIDATIFDPAPVPQVDLTARFDNELDQSSTLGKSVDVDTSGSIQFCGEFVSAGTEINADESGATFIGLHFDIRGDAQIVNSNAKAQHVKRIERSGLMQGATGNCVTPGR